MSSVTHLFNIFLERFMSNALEEHDGKVSIGGRNITNLWFANDIDALAEEEQELEALVESLDKTCTRVNHNKVATCVALWGKKSTCQNFKENMNFLKFGTSSLYI